MFKTSTTFDKLLDKATSLTNLEPDWTTIIQICDSLRQNDVQPKYALSGIKKKLNATNPNVQLLTLQVLESCVKNCGAAFHMELTTRTFMEDVHEVLRNTTDNKVRDEILRLIQAWAHAFRNEPSYRAIQDEMRLMKAEGYQFPVFKESDAMFSADTAPEWSDGERCHRCRLQFTMLVRKHHCRNCGQVFCAKCSSKFSTIPKFGIEKEVRVCDVCYEKINKKTEPKQVASEKPKTEKPQPTNSSTPRKSEQEIQEEEELQLALALSKSEAESKEMERMRYYQVKQKNGTSSSSNSSASKHKKSSKTSRSSSKSSKKSLVADENEDPELARYLNREYWEQKTTGYCDYENSPSPSAPQPVATSTLTKGSSFEALESTTKLVDKTGNDSNEAELESFTNNLRSTIEIFVNRLNSNKLRGRAITNDSGVESLFVNLTNLHSRLIMYMQQTNEARSNCERLQDKITQIRDARAALDALRDEHREQLRRAAEEAERIRQQQMAQKLEIMRKKKQEYLQYQRELAIQRMQEQEREMLMRSEQLKFAAMAPSAAMTSGQWPNTSHGVNFNPAASMPQAAYYLPSNGQSFSAPVLSQPQGQPMVSHYVQAPLANGANLVAAQHPPMPTIVPPVAATLPPSQQYLPTQMATPQYMAHMSNAPPATGYPPEVTPTPYTPVQAPTHPQNAPLPPAASEVKEELLINFD